ncbi:MAG TPA: hypothetical protein HPQ03_09490 [Deltaproteobacteria bacterium]|nr:hypothetical protein [Deltaproteobacteria bacterium]
MKKKSICYGALIIIGIFILYFGVKIYTEKTVQRNIDNEIRKITQFADVKYDDLQVDILGPSIRLKDVVITPKFWKEEIRIDEGVFYDLKNEDGIPSNIRFNLEGIHFKITRPNSFLKPYIDSMGLENVKADLECAVSYDKKDRILNVKQIKLGAGGVGKAQLSLRLKNFDPETIGSLPQNIVLLLITLSGVSIESAEIKYQDETLMDKIITVAARQKSQQADDYYQSIVQRLEQAFENETDPDVKTAIKGILDFMKKKDKVSIMVAPKRPVPIGKLYWIRDLKRLVDLLGIKIAA